MSLRRFPWKAPRQTDRSYSLFAKVPEQGKPGYDELKRLEEGTLSKHVSAASGEERRESVPSDQILGPWRLLRLLPREARQIVGKMLEVDPLRRATLAEVCATNWVQDTPTCEQLEGGQVERAEGHNHILEPGGTEAPDPNKK